MTNGTAAVTLCIINLLQNCFALAWAEILIKIFLWCTNRWNSITCQLTWCTDLNIIFKNCAAFLCAKFDEEGSRHFQLGVNSTDIIVAVFDKIVV